MFALEVQFGLAAGFAPLGLFLMRYRPEHPVSRLIALIGGLAVLSLLAAAGAAWLPLAWLSEWVWLPAYTLIPLTLLYFPDGVHSRAARRLAQALAACVVGATLALAVAAAFDPRHLLDGSRAQGPALTMLLLVAAAVMAILALSTVVLVVYLRRLRAADTLRRRQLACVAPALVLFVVYVVMSVPGVVQNAVAPFVGLPALLALPIGMTVAIMQYRLDDLDTLADRTVVWLLMSGLVLAVYTAAVVVVAQWVPGGSTATIVVATAVIAAAFQPVRQRLQRLVNRMLYGRRDEPFAVLADLGERMRLVADPRTMLEEIPTSVVSALRVPFCRLQIVTNDGLVPVAVEGRELMPPVEVRMLRGEEQVGVLQVSPRRPGEEFNSLERRLLNELANQAALAASSYRLTLDLQRSREALVAGREDERRRLRRDLHDGLGPSLVGSRMQIVAVARACDESVQAALAEVQHDLARCSAEVRRLVDGLRPAELDAGLAHALREELPRIAGDLHVAIEADHMTDLPAAVEVAGYRIVSEAVTNVVKHAQATNCRITLRRNEAEVRIEIADDGLGGFTVRDGGVGSQSMRARAEELGGTWDVASGHDGTTITACLPASHPDSGR